MITSPDPATIAARLTESERSAIRHVMQYGTRNHPGVMTLSVMRIVAAFEVGSDTAEFTPLGRAVADVLEVPKP